MIHHQVVGKAKDVCNIQALDDVLCGGFTFGQDKVPIGHFPSHLRTTKTLDIGFFNENLHMEFGTWECLVHPKT